MAQDLAQYAGTELHRLMVDGRWRISQDAGTLHTQGFIVARRAVAQYYGCFDRPSS